MEPVPAFLAPPQAPPPTLSADEFRTLLDLAGAADVKLAVAFRLAEMLTRAVALAQLGKSVGGVGYSADEPIPRTNSAPI